ncbi:MAG: GIY-YIG nuclease family protein [Maribacter sp.]|nr:GIY-YIG nuclease family protein [Maribacter sp.]
MYTIVDIETTGNGIKGNKITEISIFRFDGQDIVDEFTTLVNPECEIPFFITRLTGIDNAMVRNSPRLHEVADQIKEITQDTIFVAHSVNFDYNVIKHEFKGIGLDFTRKKLCTVRLSRKLFPGYNSYSLGKLCSALKIPLVDRHRARGDAHATVLLFKKLLGQEGAKTVVKTFLNSRSQEATLPPSLPKKVFDALPNRPGVYYFKNNLGKIIYVGKAINIKKRVLGHFYDKSTKEIQLCQATADIDFELSGSELLALLMESNAIKKHYPLYNRAQKATLQQYGIFSYEDRNGILHLAFNKLKSVPHPLITFHNTTDCRLYLEEICKTYQLCAKYCHLQENVVACSHYRIPICQGVCRGAESPLMYNEKVLIAIDDMQTRKEDFIIKEKGRHLEEQAFILVRNDVYLGYGFIPIDQEIGSTDDLMGYMVSTKNSVEARGIIRSYANKYPDRILTPDKIDYLTY